MMLYDWECEIALSLLSARAARMCQIKMTIVAALSKLIFLSLTQSIMSNVEIRPATVQDVPLILSFIKKLAAYEKLSHEVVATEETLKETLFGERPYAQVIFAYAQKTAESPLEPAGMALYFYNYSTFNGKPGLYLEDLFVDVEFRGQGLGKKLLTQLATIAKERSCARFEWVCIDWNKPSREFYEALGAKPQSQWIIHRVEGRSLDELAAL